MINGTLTERLVSPDVSASDLPDTQLLERFVRGRDEAAFATLVRRHGPMVLGVCQRVLNDGHDAEDAFQATFLVLACKAHTLTRPELLGNWLYGVAYRTARKARIQALRRSQYERQAPVMPADDVEQKVMSRELRTLLDEELHKLPEKYKAPLVLCYLQGLTNEEAARRLGWPIGSMSYRLARGRELLRERLQRRNRALATETYAVLLVPGLGAAAVPEGLVTATVQVMRKSDGIGKAPEDSSPSKALALAALVLKAMQSSPTMVRIAVFAAIALLTVTTGILAYAGIHGRSAATQGTENQSSEPSSTTTPNGLADPAGGDAKEKSCH